MYKKIVNPDTGKKVNILSVEGKKILNKYLNYLKGGAATKLVSGKPSSTNEEPGVSQLYSDFGTRQDAVIGKAMDLNWQFEMMEERFGMPQNYCLRLHNYYIDPSHRVVFTIQDGLGNAVRFHKLNEPTSIDKRDPNCYWTNPQVFVDAMEEISISFGETVYIVIPNNEEYRYKFTIFNEGRDWTTSIYDEDLRRLPIIKKDLKIGLQLVGLTISAPTQPGTLTL